MRVNQDRKNSRLRRALKTRKRIGESNSHRLSVYRSARHIYVQLLTSNGDKVITTISTNQKKLKKKIKSNNITSSKMIGKIMADFIKKEKIKKVAFDRSGYKYHGKIKALADSIRENGVKI
ncbi:MAG: 50S ribosomal protein L18 [Gammaproteobacteria bacterium]